VYTGPDPVLAQVSGALGGGLIFLNGQGDIVYDDVFDEDWFEAIDLTTAATPEPASLFLFGTGALGALGIMRKRLFQ
jgi:hypothetical protein